MSSAQGRLALTERDRKERALAAMEDSELRRYLLTRLRKYAKRLYLDRVERHGERKAYVCADDVRRYLERELEPPEGLSRNFLGACFGTVDWETDGSTVQSNTPGSHGNRILRWSYTGGTE